VTHCTTEKTKTLGIIVAILVLGCFAFGKTGAPNTYALKQSVLPRTFYENMSGFEHGVHDAFLTNQNLTTYISQPGHDMGHHAQVFNDVYAKGWCSVMGLDHGIEEPYAEFDCVDQP
jgi:hypothetical protein